MSEILLKEGKKVHSLEIESTIDLDMLETGKNCKAIEASKLSERYAELNKKLIKFVKKESKLLIIVNDAMRVTPTAKILEKIAESFHSIELEILIATGSHRNPKADEIQQILGEFSDNITKIHIHDAYNIDSSFKVCTTSRGNDVYLNKLISDFRRIITISSIEPHYFAGFTGGRKSFLPGVACIETIRRNHEFALNKNAAVMSLENNPVHEDSDEVLDYLELESIFSIQTVLSEDQISHISYGDLRESFISCVEYSKRAHAADVESEYNLVICVVQDPLNLNLYQAHKAIENNKSILRKGGTFILITECEEGIGQDSFFELLLDLQTGDTDITDRDYILGDHKAYKLKEFLETYKLVIVGKTIEKIETAGIHQFKSLQSAVDAFAGSCKRIAIIPDGGMICSKVVG